MMTNQQPDNDETTPIHQLAHAIQRFAADDSEQIGLVTGSVTVYEVTIYEDDGSTARRISYTAPHESTGMAQALGLLVAGQRLLEADILGDEDES
jgi:hypothetical protein